MFDGKMLRGATGMPMRMTARANSSFALAEPEPLTLAEPDDEVVYAFDGHCSPA